MSRASTRGRVCWAAIGAMVTLHGCGAPFTSDQYAATGGAGGPGGEPGGAAAGAPTPASSGGTLDECGAGRMCVPSAPEGWTPPGSLYVGSDPPACARGTSAIVAGHVGDPIGAVSCAACACQTPSPPTCSMSTTVYSGPGCGGSTRVVSLTSSCTAANAMSTKPGTLTAQPGTCVATGGAATLGDVEWEAEGRVCAATAPAEPCGDGGVCLARAD